ncbi:Cellulose-binding family ii protein [Apiospora arundinis]
MKLSLGALLALGASAVLGLPHFSALEDPSSTNLVARSAGCGKNAISSGTKSINVNGKNRQYILRVPNNYNSNRQYKLIFAFHWVGGTMQDISSGGTDRELWSYYGMQRTANESAILVAPQGLNNGWGNSGGEDLKFVDAMVSSLKADLCVDEKQLYSIGFSYGGSMSYSIACSRAKTFRGVAVMSGGQLSGCDGGNDPIAYLGIHGISDGTLNIAGGRSLRDRFVKNNGCTAASPPEPPPGQRRAHKDRVPRLQGGIPSDMDRLRRRALPRRGGPWPREWCQELCSWRNLGVFRKADVRVKT